MVVGDGMYAKPEGDADPLGQASLKPGSQYRRGVRLRLHGYPGKEPGRQKEPKNAVVLPYLLVEASVGHSRWPQRHTTGNPILVHYPPFLRRKKQTRVCREERCSFESSPRAQRGHCCSILAPYCNQERPHERSGRSTTGPPEALKSWPSESSKCH